ncbi:sodium-dependent glucose transporter 1-like [Antedon mediterranea]|uniref:sodium-dependent glucose transporter 1-like n=1 Tax=Antedon mediterranea TaxID=105859 RepID=UPI003AF82D5E
MSGSSDDEEELFDIGLTSDHASLINSREKDDNDGVGTLPVHNKRILKTVILFSSFISLGLAVAILGPTIPNLILQVGTGYSQLSFIFLTRGFGYMVGAVVAGFLIERFNPFRLLGFSLALCAIAMVLMPAVKSLQFLILLFILAGFAMGCLDTGGNVMCIQIWGPQSAPYMQALHFSFAIGALVAPLLAKPFIDIPFSGNATALDVVCQLGQSSHSLITEHVDTDVQLSSVSSLTIPPLNTVTKEFTTLPPKDIFTKKQTPEKPVTTKMIPPTTVAQIITTQPGQTTKGQVQTTIEQVKTTIKLFPTTTKPVLTTAEPVPTTAEPVPTTAEPVPTTTEPVPTTTEPVPTTAESVPTTAEQVPTTAEPVPTTTEPVPTTAEPVPANLVHTTIANPISTTFETLIFSTSDHDTPEFTDETLPQIVTATHESLPNNNHLKTKIDTLASSLKQTSPPTTSVDKQTSGKEDGVITTSDAVQETSTADEGTIVTDFSSVNSEGSTVEESSSTKEEEKEKRTTIKVTTKTKQSKTKSKRPKNKSLVRRDIGLSEDLTVNQTDNSPLYDGAKLWNVYGILFFVITLNSIAFFYLSFKGGHYKQSHLSAAKSLAHQNDNTFRLQLLSIMFVFYFLYVGSEVAYGSFIFSYGRFSDLQLDKDQASLLNSLYWGTFAVFRGLAIILARCMSPLTMLLIDLIGCGISSLILVIFKGTNSLALWVGTAVLGASMASLFPSGLSWLGRYIKVTGTAASVLVVGASSGEMAIPFVVGHFFPDWCHPDNNGGKNIQMLMYTMLVVTIFTSFIFLIAYRIAKKRGDRYKGHHLVPDSSMMLELQSTD